MRVQLAVLSVGTALLLTPAQAQTADPAAIVSGLKGLANNPPDVRATNAKGTCAKGVFTPAASAAGLSKAPFLAGPTPFTARFAMGGGNPRVPDTTKPVTRGFSMRLEPAVGDPMSLVMISAPVFFARTPDQMLGFIQARLPGPSGQPDPEKIRIFSAANPNTLVQAGYLNARPVPASWAGANYWAVQAYTLTNASGAAATVKFKAVPLAGTIDLTDDELKSRPANFYADDLRDRLARGPVGFDLTVIIAKPGDITSDSTAQWPEDSRTKLILGRISVSDLVPDAVCNAFTFDPVPLPAGIAGPTDDPLFQIRSPAYAISFSQRLQ